MPSGIYPRKSWQERLEERIDVRGPDDCWPWTGERDDAGYGELSVDGRSKRATHCLFKIRTGNWVPKGKMITHKVCGNPPCCNARHLRLGTAQSNSNDMVRDGNSNKGRHINVGERHWCVKLTDVKVRKIKRDLARGDETHREIAERYCVSSVAITHINTGRTWKHVAA